MRGRLGVALVVAVALGLGGCSDDGGEGARPSPADAAAGDLEAAFTYEVELGESGPTHCPVLALRFTDESRGEPTAWSWDFGRGATSTEQHPVVHREVVEATLTITRGDARDTVTQPVTFPVC